MSGVDLIKRSLFSLRQHPWLALMAGTAATISLTLVALFVLISQNVQQAVDNWSNDFQIIIYIDPPPAETLAREWQTALNSMVETEDVTYVSSSEALQLFRDRLGKDAILIDGIGSDILPASFVVKLKPDYRNRVAVKNLVSRIADKDEWRDVQYGAEWIERLDALRKLIRMTGIVFGLFLFIATFFIVANTIRLTLFTRKEEIKIMRLLGATPLYIGMPFILEGAILGGIGGGVAISLSYLFYQLGLQQGLILLLQLLGIKGTAFLPFIWQIGLLGGGILLGLVASLVALRRLSKV